MTEVSGANVHKHRRQHSQSVPNVPERSCQRHSPKPDDPLSVYRADFEQNTVGSPRSGVAKNDVHRRPTGASSKQDTWSASLSDSGEQESSSSPNVAAAGKSTASVSRQSSSELRSVETSQRQDPATSLGSSTEYLIAQMRWTSTAMDRFEISILGAGNYILRTSEHLTMNQVGQDTIDYLQGCLTALHELDNYINNIYASFAKRLDTRTDAEAAVHVEPNEMLDEYATAQINDLKERLTGVQIDYNQT